MTSREEKLHQVVALFNEQRADDAAQLLDEILAADPNDPDAADMRGTLQFAARDMATAAELFDRAAPARTQDSEFQLKYARALIDSGRPADAEAPARQALAARPAEPYRMRLLVQSLRVQGKEAEAEKPLRNLVAALPGDATTVNELGLCLNEQDKVAAAEVSFRQAAEIDPKMVQAWHNLGNSLLDQHRPEAAVEAFDKALEWDPKHPTSRVHRAYALLLAGDYDAGLDALEDRWDLPRTLSPRADLTTPLWDGTPFPEKTLLIYAEQGFGDTIQFSRQVAAAKALGGRVVLDVQRPLVRLMQSLDGPDEVSAADGQPAPAHDLRLPAMSLPRVLGTRPETIPGDTPYLTAPDPGSWDAFLSDLPGMKIGLVWNALAESRRSIRRSIPLSDLAPLLGVDGVSWVSLQKHVPEGDRPLPDALIDPADRMGDFADTADLIMGLDLVVAVDTAVAHLAGALGRPVWMMLTAGCDWRWGQDGADCPWYPSARLYRKSRIDGWTAVVADIVRDLAERVP